MHRDKAFGIIEIDPENGAVAHSKIYEREYAPFLGNADESKIKKWWDLRAVPSSRKAMENVIRRAGCVNSHEYLAKNLALSITDTYWICPVDMNLRWDDVKLYNRDDASIISYHNVSSYDPNASLGGNLEKAWDISREPAQLLKTTPRYYGLQSINEVFATLLHERQKTANPFVKYALRRLSDGVLQSVCDAFTSEKIEFIPAYEVVLSEKTANNISRVDAYIDICERHGISHRIMRDYMDYQIITDFVISNTDEHLLNFGVLRDAETMQLVGPAPIFDSGNSMFYNRNLQKPLDRRQLLETEITGMYDKEEKILSHVRNREIVKTDLLPSSAEAENFYVSHGIDSQQAHAIAESYRTKVLMLEEFQRGETISLYNEKRKAGSL